MEVGEVTKYNLVTVIWKDAAIAIAKHGVYRLDGDLAALKVFDGEAVVTAEGRKIKVGKGKMLAFDGSWMVAKFDRDETDALDRWSGRRTGYLAMVNVPTARTGARSARYSYWECSPYYGMCTFIPHHGMYSSYYGYRFYSPSAVMAIYNPPRVNVGGFGGGIGASPGYSTASSTSAGTSGTIAASSPASTSSSSASSAPVARDSVNAGGARR